MNTSFLVYKNFRMVWVWFILAQFSFLTTIGLPYQGEEAVYTITSLEMAFNQEWLVPTLYGNNYARPPLLNWFIIPLASGLGWDSVLIASRLVTTFATTLTTVVLIWLVQKLFKNRSLSVFSALVYMSGDVLFRRGWLAYADPLFSLFVFSAIACLWVAMLEKRTPLLWLAAMSLIASFLTKAITGYVFYGIAVAVLYWRYSNSDRAFMLRPASLIIHGLSLLFPLIWNVFLSEGAHVGSMIHDVLAKLSLEDLRNYGIKLLIYPLDTLLRWLPVSALMLYFLARRILNKGSLSQLLNANAIVALWILGLNYIPYWLAPESHIRYLMPLYPLFALVMTYLFWQLGEQKVKIVFAWLVIGIIIRYLVGLVGLPYYETHYRGNYQAVAKDILTFVKNEPLYSEDYSAASLSVAANLDVLRMPKSPLTNPKATWDNGFLIARQPEMKDTKISKIYFLNHHPLYLLCRGKACNTSQN